MNERNLHVLLSRILLATTSLSLSAGCGGTAESDADSTASGGSTGSGGAASGGALGTGGSGTGGSGTGGIVQGTGGLIDGAGGLIGTGGVVGAGGSIVAVDCMGPASSPSLCNSFYVTADASCFAQPTPTVTECSNVCGLSVVFGVCTVTDIGDDKVSVYCPPSCAVGRRPAGLEPAAMRKNELGEYFARAAYLEAASVRAFRDLRSELRARRAPRSLLRALDRAARDELRHARSTSALARRFGGSLEAPKTRQPAPRTLEALATENMVEGCVRETYGALTAHHQAEAAKDSCVRAELLRIARDETRHAALSWRVQRWLESRLEPEARKRVQEARDAAAAELYAELEGEPAPEIVERAGVPSAAKARRLWSGLASALWS